MIQRNPVYPSSKLTVNILLYLLCISSMWFLCWRFNCRYCAPLSINNSGNIFLRQTSFVTTVQWSESGNLTSLQHGCLIHSPLSDLLDSTFPVLGSNLGSRAPHLDIISLHSSLIWNSSSELLCFHDLDIFKEYKL